MLSTNYANKLRAIRKAEGLTQKKFAEITGLSPGNIKNYETKQNEAKGLAVEKVLSVKRFQKYTMWLMTDTTNPEFGQVAPFSNASDSSKVTTTSSTLPADKGLRDRTEQESGVRTTDRVVTHISADNCLRLAKILHEEGLGFLSECLAPENQLLLNLSGNKKRAALQLVSLSREKFETMVCKMEALIESPPEETNTSKKNPAD